ncbi:uncharacterized protein BXZ73DRAFT_76542 [Epithele typhae]|uniref:uncharacterized protein n=1 Tax=Epithele typhae TaxID=378194 RepID=UPI0020077218|nr:uncharacterized protein BXZ73DRAFT_76542 [Epithele typhae]KAH9937923.1 hypothetical protein BXZ73DRAFT_76542 [Epithele typhae]
MRESNFAFPAQNRACVCISSQLYDRRALDTNSSLPLFNSLTHLVYLTSTSPRIREIMTADGGLERLVRILRDFCLSPPPPENPSIFYGLAPPGSHPPKPAPILLPKTYDKHAGYRFSLAFQCIANIGVRGSEPIRSRVVEAGTLEVVGCILEAWLASKGFAVGPAVAANGMPRETREQRLARRQAQSEIRAREQREQREQHTIAAIQRALERQVSEQPEARAVEPSGRSGDTSHEVRTETRGGVRVCLTAGQEPMQTEATQPPAGSSRVQAQEEDTSAETSTNATPNRSNTPTGSVVVPGRDRSGTILAQPVWDQPANTARRAHRARPVQDNSAGPSTSTSAANSRPETETEDDGDGDGDVDMDTSRDDNNPSPSPERQQNDGGTIRTAHSRRAVGIVSDAAAPTTVGQPGIDIPSDAHIIINDEGGVPGVGVEDGLVSLETNDDFAMGAPPGAPGALDGPPAPRTVADGHPGAGERTPRAGTTNLPMTAPRAPAGAFLTPNLALAEPAHADATTPGRQNTIRAGAAGTGAGLPAAHHHHHHREVDTGPYRDEDVVLGLQLLAYLSKYPHCRQAFYKPRQSFHPATTQVANGQAAAAASASSSTSASASSSASVSASASTSRLAGGSGSSSSISAFGRESNPLIKAFQNATGRGKEKERAPSANGVATVGTDNSVPRLTNLFALVERFTYRHSSSELESAHPPPSLPPEIQYWAGVIMRNACRKDDSRGGIRQCANMLCGKWERFPREFAKCRRCRKAKYCGKECQSTAWSEGHRFWCSAKDPDEEGEHAQAHGHGHHHHAPAAPPSGAANPGRAERREARERERQARAMAAEQRLQRDVASRVTVGNTAPGAGRTTGGTGPSASSTTATSTTTRPTAPVAGSSTGTGTTAPTAVPGPSGARSRLWSYRPQGPVPWATDAVPSTATGMTDPRTTDARVAAFRQYLAVTAAGPTVDSDGPRRMLARQLTVGPGPEGETAMLRAAGAEGGDAGGDMDVDMAID